MAAAAAAGAGAGTADAKSTPASSPPPDAYVLPPGATVLADTKDDTGVRQFVYRSDNQQSVASSNAAFFAGLDAAYLRWVYSLAWEIRGDFDRVLYIDVLHYPDRYQYATWDQIHRFEHPSGVRPFTKACSLKRADYVTAFLIYQTPSNKALMEMHILQIPILGPPGSPEASVTAIRNAFKSLIP